MISRMADRGIPAARRELGFAATSVVMLLSAILISAFVISAILISALASREWFGLLTCRAITGDWAASLLVPTAWFR
jgi:hypothetical protein